MDKIPLFKVRMSPEVPDRLREVIASGTITEGPRVAEFEQRLSVSLDCWGVLTMNSATSALHLAAVLAGSRGGSEVISTPITCAATNTALLQAGVDIVWADVDPMTGLVAPDDIARKVTPRTRAVMVVDWGGAICDVARIRKLVGPNVAIIEDAAHAFRAMREYVHSDFVCWSFQAIKHLTTGDGGALYVADADVRDKARRMRWFGIDRQAPGPNIDKLITEPGFKYHMNDLDATIGLANLPLATQSVEAHRANAACLDDALRDLAGITLPRVDPTSAWWLYTIVLHADDAQQRFIAHMAEYGIECSKVHSRNDAHPVFGRFGHDRHGEQLPGVAHFDSHQVCIPCGWWIGELERQRIVDAVRAWERA